MRALPLVLLAALSASAEDAIPGRIVVRPAEIAWTDAPPSVPKGASAAVLEGDPRKDGLFTLRLRLPAGYVLPPHRHGGPERVTVVSGSVLLAVGPRPEKARAERFPAGSYYLTPAGLEHAVWAAEESVLQVTTHGPWQITYVDPADDPRKPSPAPR